MMYDSSIAKSFKLVLLRLNNTIWAEPFLASVWDPVQVKTTGIAVMLSSAVFTVISPIDFILESFRLNK